MTPTFKHFWGLRFMGVSENGGFSPQIIHFDRVFHYKPSILGYHYFWKHPYGRTNPVIGNFYYMVQNGWVGRTRREGKKPKMIPGFVPRKQIYRFHRGVGLKISTTPYLPYGNLWGEIPKQQRHPTTGGQGGPLLVTNGVITYNHYEWP